MDGRWGRVWRVLGSYTLGIVLMAILLILTVYGTFYQVQDHAGIGSAEAAEAFFGASLVLIPLGGEHAVAALPLPGMWVVCCLLFINLLAGGVIRAPKGFGHWGVLTAHVGILLLLASVALGGRMTTRIDSINMDTGHEFENELLDIKMKLDRFAP